MSESNGTETLHAAGGGDIDGDRHEVTVRPATKADLAKFYPELTCSFRAWTALIDGEPRGVGGIAFTRPYPSIFSKIEDGYEGFAGNFTIKRRMIKKIENAAKELGRTVHGVTDEGGDAFLMKRMGFRLIGEFGGHDLYELEGGHG